MGKKIRVGVIFGGRSGEHEVSLQSARSVMAALDRNKYEVVEIGISRTGRWLLGGAMAALDSGEMADAQPVSLLPDPERHALVRLDDANPGHVVELEGEGLDVLIPILHGTYGEDGTVQGLLEMAGMPYVGAGVVGSAVGMDKAIFKMVMAANGIPVLPWQLVTADKWRQMPERVIEILENELVYPLFTKPANLGSSVGINKCKDQAALVAGLNAAFEYDRRVVVEQGAVVRELEVAVLGNAEPEASIVGEVRPRREFYDYEAKYISDDSELLIPAPLSETEAAEVRRLALRAYRAIDCAGMGRVDLLMEKATGRIYLNEINTIPGFTSISMYPKLWEATGLPYGQLLDRLIELALERHEEKRGLRTTL
ncbi:MAG: D-alanine--D-alanine ligase [Ardenticatenales bacterium]|nr:D-alanine--D-alanine ligase [Ardenticatenales bacterium]